MACRLITDFYRRYHSIRWVGSRLVVRLRSPLTDGEGEVPSADELAAELEKFLAIRRRSDDDA